VSKPSTDWVLFNGKIYTVDLKDSIAEAILIKDGKIQRVGSSEEILRLAPDPVQELDLEGRTVTPGFIDCHNHTVAYGFSLLGSLYLEKIIAAIASFRLRTWKKPF